LLGRENLGARYRAAQSSRKRPLGDASKSGGRRVITIALSLFSTTVVTAVLGFAFWALTAHITTTEVVGRTSAVISAMGLIASFGTLGCHIMLTAELPRRDAADAKRLVVTSLAIAGGLAFAIAVGYGVVNHNATKTSEWIYATPIGIALFGVGTALTTVTVVLDGALVGVQQAGRQTSRNLVFSLVKLIALPVAAFAIGLSPQVIFSVLLLGNLVSLLTLGLRIKAPREWLKTMPSLREFSPLWRPVAGYHWINVAAHAPGLVMPIMVVAQLGAQANAGFYAALLLVAVVWMIPYHLATGILTLDGGNAEHFGHGLSTALRLSGVVSVLAAAGAPILARPVLAIFGPEYEQARYCLIALATCTFANAVKFIYIPVRRAQGALGKAALAVTLGAALELGAAELGLKLGGVTGIGIALGTAMVVEAAIFWPHIRKARRRFDQQDTEVENNHSAEEREISNADDRAWETGEVSRDDIHSVALVQVAKPDQVYERFKSLAAPRATQSNGFGNGNGAGERRRLLISKHAPIFKDQP
jgi:O-antigen/teichoic acid export membrane protein